MTDLAEETRAIYHAQHDRLANDEKALRRHLGMFQEDYFGLGEGWFEGKGVLDAGCGNMAKAAIRFAQFGAYVHAFDLGTEWMPTALVTARANGWVSLNLRSGDVLDIPYADETFDFVCCHGVLIHLNGWTEVEHAFSELERVTKPGGYLYTVWGLCGGLFEEAVWPWLRRHYRENRAFRVWIDNLEPEDIREMIPADPDAIDVDLCVYLQNVIQAPVRLQIPEKWIRQRYGNFEDVRRLRRYVERTNVRKYEAPLHFNYQHPLSRMLYGSGNLEFIGRKSI